MCLWDIIILVLLSWATNWSHNLFHFCLLHRQPRRWLQATADIWNSFFASCGQENGYALDLSLHRFGDFPMCCAASSMWRSSSHSRAVPSKVWKWVSSVCFMSFIWDKMTLWLWKRYFDLYFLSEHNTRGLLHFFFALNGTSCMNRSSE